MTARFVPFVLASIAIVVACSTPPSGSRYTQTTLPDPASFQPVAQLLALRCGTIDCHGTPYRNLRVYGSAGLRWSPSDRPFVPLCDTPDEVEQDYLSVVGLEPETTNAVASGAAPATLTTVRKARGTEAHKGGQIWTQGDDSDVCLTAWLTGQTSASACRSAVVSVLPNALTNPLLQCLTP